MDRTTIVLLIISFVIILLHVWGALEPSHYNWGVHFFAFFEPWISLLILMVVVLLAIPKIQSPLLKVFDRLLQLASKLPTLLVFLILGGIVIVSALLFPAKLHFLGDGAVLLRSVNERTISDEIAFSFRNQPLMQLIYLWTLNFYPPGSTVTTYDLYRTVDVIAALLFLVVLFWLVRMLQGPLLERVLLGCFVFFGAGSQFFFGYVENYVFFYVAIAAFVITGWRAFEKRIHLIIPLLVFVLMAGFHLGSLVFTPALLFLLFHRWKKHKLRAVILLASIAVAVSFLFFTMGFNVKNFLVHLTQGGVDFLQPFSGRRGNFPYPMFSLIHLVDWLNANMLIVPFGLILTTTLLVAHRSTIPWKKPIPVFLLITAGCGLFFTWIVNNAPGMARDWDLLASFFVPLLFATVYLMSQPLPWKPRGYALIVIVAVTFFHWASWIGVNASADRHLARMKLLNNPKLLSPVAQTAYDEALANFYFNRANYAEARYYYEHLVQIDDRNPRIIGNLADTYRKLGEKEKYFNTLQRAVQMNTQDAGVYSNLGVEYASRGDTSNAILYNEKALQLKPNQEKAHANLGILYAAKKDYPRADQHFRTAVELGMREPVLFRYAADVCLFLEDYTRALQYYDAYLERMPNDERVRKIRDKIRASLPRIGNP
ncbi:MAG: tetratricopeptide repeat protein [Ignavibacteriae bacterium]|nr:tetratricopeptide repeat protein [Ignavibacteriota bacterium]